jgi:hypothetical protein
MANATYDNLWQQAISELSEQLNVEGADDEDDNGSGDKSDVSVFTSLFLCSIYISIFRNHVK